MQRQYTGTAGRIENAQVEGPPERGSDGLAAPGPVPSGPDGIGPPGYGQPGYGQPGYGPSAYSPYVDLPGDGPRLPDPSDLRSSGGAPEWVEQRSRRGAGRRARGSRAPDAPGPGAQDRSATPDQRARLRRRRWTPGQLSLRLDLAPAGVALGVESDGTPATFPMLVPTHSTRVGILAEAGLARLVALRLLGQSCDLTVVTHHFDTWQRLSAGVPETPFAISEQLRRWPLEGTPPPWALLIDMDDPPPTGFTRVPWSTVVHLAPALPTGSGWWQSAHLVLTTRAHVRSVAALRPRADLSALEHIADDDIVAVHQSGFSVFRSALSRREYHLLSAVDQVAARG